MNIDKGAAHIAESQTLIHTIPTTSRDEPIIQWKDTLRQTLASCIAHCIVIPAGVNMAFSSILLPELKSTTDVPISKSQASWIASLVTIVLPFGTIVAGLLMDKFGRKKTCMFTTIPFGIGWIVMATATNVGTLYFARILTGISSGLTTTSLVYISEICHPNFRGMLLNLNSVYVSLGILLTCILGYFMNWRSMCYVFLAIDIGVFFILLLIPESPHWLVAFKHNQEAASRSLRWLYTNAKIYDNENHRLFSSTRQTNEVENEFRFFRLDSYRSPVIYKPLILLSSLFIIQQLTGAYVITFYTIDIFTKVMGNEQYDNVAYLSFVVLGIIRFIISVIGTIVSKRIGRRYLLAVSCAGMCITSLIASVYVYVKESDFDYNGYIVLICILAYVAFSSVGMVVIPWTLISELLPIRARGRLGSLLIGLAYVYMFGVVKVFPSLLSVLSMRWILLGFSVINLIGIGFVYRCLPETLGKRLSDIEEYFLQRS